VLWSWTTEKLYVKLPVFIMQTHRKLSKSNVKKQLNFYGYKRRVVKKKIVISKVNRIQHRAWCRSKLHMTVNNYWKKIIFWWARIIRCTFGAGMMRNGLQDILESTLTPMSELQLCFGDVSHMTEWAHWRLLMEISKQYHYSRFRLFAKPICQRKFCN
jgi:hypothetical protein